jgi:hypothetical protein
VVLIDPAGTFVGLSWKFCYAMLIKAPILRLMRPGRPRDITDFLGNDPPLRSSDASWVALMSVTMSESARPNTVSPIVFSESELQAIRAPTLLLIGVGLVLASAAGARPIITSSSDAKLERAAALGDEAPAAFDHMENGDYMGKIVIRVP